MDLISRQAAIDAVMEFMPSLTTPDGTGEFDAEIFAAQEMFVDIGQALSNLPSVQPELIRCKDCKHYEFDKMNEDYCCMKWGYNFPEQNDFCSYAERLEDG